MSDTSLTRPTDVITVVRGAHRDRPLADRDAAAWLRDLFEQQADALAAGYTFESPRRLRTSDLRTPPAVRDLHSSPLGRLRGVLVSTLARLRAHGVAIDHPFADAVAVLSVDRPGPLREALEALDDNDRARLAADVEAHYVTLARHLGPVSSNWRPRTAVRTRVRVAGGRLELHDVADLVIGSVNGERAALGVIDVTTAPLGVDEEKTLRFHALTATLRNEVAPLRVCVLSTATGERWALDVDRGVLARAVDDVLAAVAEGVAA